MEYRALAAGIEVSRLALGGGVFGRDCGKDETIAVLNAAADAGINFVDTADIYSRGLSEEWVGAAIRGSRRRWVVATKAGVPPGEPRAGKGRRDRILRCAEESLTRLRLDVIDLYQAHHFDPETPLEETLEALDLLVQQGKARAVGASNYSGEELRAALRVASARGVAALSTTQIHYNLLKRSAEGDQLPVCSAEGVRILAYGALGRGVLTGKYRPESEVPADWRAFSSPAIRADLAPPIFAAVEKLAGFAAARNQTVGNLAIAWVLRREEVAAVIMGVRSPEQLKANVAAASWKLSPADLTEIDARVGDPASYRGFFSYGG